MTLQPNIILFLTDQLRRDAPGCYGNTICQTPNLDKLAQEGVHFENAFTVSPVCSPARASLLTGLYPHNHGLMLNTHIAPAWSRGLSPTIPTFSAILKQAGYALDYVGKWHVHEDLDPCAYGFDRFEKCIGKEQVEPGSDISIHFGSYVQLIAGTNQFPKRETPPWRRTQMGITMLQERAAGEQPFFLRIDLAEPHFPCMPPEPYASLYNPKDIPPWPNFDETFAGKPEGHLRKHEQWHLQDKGWEWWSRVLAKYYGMITFIDACVGKVLKTVDDLGLADRTIFLFCADHGDAMGSHRHFEKAGTMYDEVFRLPLLVKGPQPWVKSGRVSAFVRSMDLMPTFVEWSGAQLPSPMDGMSLAPFLRDETPAGWPDSVYCEHHGEVWGYQFQRMVRTQRWKYVYNPLGMDELYDLRQDPNELANRVRDEAFGDVLQEMKARLLGWNDATNDMCQWPWVRGNFPPPISPFGISAKSAPHTTGS